MPQVILLIAFLLWLSFFLYDRCAAAQDSYILAFRGSILCGEKNGEVQEYIRTNTAKQIGVKYFGITNIEKKAEADSGEVRVFLGGKMAMAGWHFQSEMKAVRICPVKYIRLIRIAEKKIEN